MHPRFRTLALRCTVAASLAGLAGMTFAGSASAHMGIDLRGAAQTAGKSSVIFFRPGHGCAGDATNALTITIPTGVTGVKAQQKPGWTVKTTADTVTWTGGALPDDQFDDFGLRLTWPKLPDGVASQPFYFKAVQTCDAELKVTRTGKEASITGTLPARKGAMVDLLVDDIPLTRHPVKVGDDGRLTVRTSAARIPEGSQVIARIGGAQVGNSVNASEAWIQIPTADATTILDFPAPSVLVIAGG